MAEYDNRPFHVVAVVLALIAGLIGRAVTYPHPQAWLFGAAAALAVLVPAETAFFVLNGRRRRPAREKRAPEPEGHGHDHYSLLGRALTAIETARPGETELSGAFRRAVAMLEKRKGERSEGVLQLHLTVRQLTMKLERSVQDENPDQLMLGQRMHLFQEVLEDAIGAAEPR
ncbi:hypothetical protein GCM10027598_65860 [Amycolatopsis oliviviridis]|uniref:Uncharacterized protein n=1 Tax=Amycolatopsis oliviviridis TaxID=1471590 RepID=A0ABQ3MAA1_9PSEU|nr:hypothetical protein [Amycolatopsis oliviviridis]GHH30699.1 hypothetical protein GCM10017790_64890 [Amycolatopsis oliviviridis]